MRLRCLFEYGALEPSRVSADDVYRLIGKPNTFLAVYHPASGEFAKGSTRGVSHSNLIWQLEQKGVENPGMSARAYWFPDKGALVLYQMETLTRRIIDPPEHVFDAFIDKLGIGNQVSQLYIIEDI